MRRNCRSHDPDLSGPSGTKPSEKPDPAQRPAAPMLMYSGRGRASRRMCLAPGDVRVLNQYCSGTRQVPPKKDAEALFLFKAGKFLSVQARTCKKKPRPRRLGQSGWMQSLMGGCPSRTLSTCTRGIWFLPNSSATGAVQENSPGLLSIRCAPNIVLCPECPESGRKSTPGKRFRFEASAGSGSFVLAGVVPGLFQRVFVKPNELDWEKPYIERSHHGGQDQRGGTTMPGTGPSHDHAHNSKHLTVCSSGPRPDGRAV